MIVQIQIWRMVCQLAAPYLSCTAWLGLLESTENELDPSTFRPCLHHNSEDNNSQEPLLLYNGYFTVDSKKKKEINSQPLFRKVEFTWVYHPLQSWSRMKRMAMKTWYMNNGNPPKSMKIPLSSNVSSMSRTCRVIKTVEAIFLRVPEKLTFRFFYLFVIFNWQQWHFMSLSQRENLNLQQSNL